MIKVSSSKRSITPEGKFFPCYLLGHAIRVDKAVGILDPIYSSAIVIDINGTKLIWISIELAGCDRDKSDEIRDELSKKYNVPFNNINLSFVHTHSAPEYSDFSPFFGKEKAQVPGYWDWVAEQIIASVDDCFAKEMEEVEVYASTTNIEGYYCNRNGLDKPCDKDITVLRFVNSEETVAIAVNFTCHPTVLGPQNLYVSPDLAGYISQQMEKKYGQYALVMQGAAGDMSNRLYRQGNDQAELERMGSGIVEQIFANKNEVRLDLNNIEVYPYHYEIHYDVDAKKTEQQIIDCEEKVKNAKNADEYKVYSSSLAAAQAKKGITSGKLDLQCTYIKMGDLAYFTMPCELFSRFGIQIKKAMNVKCPIFWGYSNYSEGYLFNIEDAGASFESAVSTLPLGTTEKVTEEICEFIQSHK